MLWAITHKGKALSSRSNEDCTLYRDFLADPQPRSRWCGNRGRERWSPLWRPFEGPLSASAQRHAVTILKNLYGFLVDQNYLMGNTWSAVGVPRTSGPKVNAGRSFSLAQWQFIEGQLKMLPATSANQRLTFGLHLLYATGLRLSEVVAATTSDNRRPVAYSRCSPKVSRWFAEVAGSIFSCPSMNCHCARLKLRPAFTFGPEVRGTPTADHGFPIR